MDGRNVIIFGPPRKFKSYVVGRVVSQLQKAGKRVVVLCSTTTALRAMCSEKTKSMLKHAVHSFFEMQTSELPTCKIISRNRKPKSKDRQYGPETFYVGRV